MHTKPIEFVLNGRSHQSCAETLKELIEMEKFELTKVATAVNGEFVPIEARENISLKCGDRIEILTARMGG